MLVQLQLLPPLPLPPLSHLLLRVVRSHFHVPLMPIPLYLYIFIE
jgi:hypothetical protein